MTFATLGDSLKIFNVENAKLNPCVTREYHNNTLEGGRGISWSGCGQWIVGPVEQSGTLPVLKYEKNKLTRMQSIRDVNASTAVFLNCTNRLLVVGSKSGAVKLWNVKDKKWHQTLRQSDPESVQFVTVSADDMYVAAAGSYSQINMYGLTTNKLLNTYSIEGSEELSALQFSPIKKNWLACSSMESSLILWDVYKSLEIMNQKKTHIGACTGIAMSPINHFIIASIALTSSFAIHDVREKNPVLQGKVDAAGSCIELMKSEPYALIGSRDGRLLMYDLRAMDTISDDPVHQKPITSVRAALMVNTKAYENCTVSTPENDCTKVPNEVSLAEIFTPPSTFTAQPLPRQFNVGSMNVETISPITLATGQHRTTIDQTTSTPNQPLFMDSFAKCFESPAASPAPSNTLFRPTPSPLANSVAPRLQLPQMLNGIHEVSESNENHQSTITREDLANLRQEILASIRNESERMIEMQRQFEKTMLFEIERSRYGVIQCAKEIEELRNVIRLEQIVEELMEKEDF